MKNKDLFTTYHRKEELVLPLKVKYKQLEVRRDKW